MTRKTAAQLNKDIADTLRPKKGAPTDLNMFALTELVLRNGGRSEFSNRLDAVDHPHIKRCLAGGLVEVSSPTTLKLTPAGATIVMRRLRENASRAAESIAIAQRRGPSHRLDEERSRERAKKIETAIETLQRSI